MDSKDRSVLLIRNFQDKILIAHAFNKPLVNGWDLIKGHIEIGENPEDAAIREAQEETGLELKIEDLNILGSFHYQGGEAFVFEVFSDCDPSSLVCTSYFDWRGKSMPELSDFEWIDECQLKEKLYKSLYVGLKNNGFLKN